MRDCVLGVDLGCDGHWHGQLVIPPTEPGKLAERVAYIECKIPDHVEPRDMVGYTLGWLQARQIEHDVWICWTVIEKPEYQDDERRSEIWVPKMQTTARRLMGVIEHLRVSRETNERYIWQVPCATIRASLGVSGAKQDYMVKMQLMWKGYNCKPGSGLGNTNQRDAMAAALWWIKQNEAME